MFFLLLTLLSEPCTLKDIGWWVGWVVANKILVTAHRPNTPFPFLDLTFMDFGLCFENNKLRDLKDLTETREKAG